jgi:hypothetical protein
MSITVGWDNDEKSILIYHYVGKWSWGEYHESITQAEQLLQADQFSAGGSRNPGRIDSTSRGYISQNLQQSRR